MNFLATAGDFKTFNDIITFGGVAFWILVGLFVLIEQLSIAYDGYKFATIAAVVFAVIIGILMPSITKPSNVLPYWQELGIVYGVFGNGCSRRSKMVRA